jgi:mannitol/fructose-specific phosphotransferase system IIA component (Ntr-type)
MKLKDIVVDDAVIPELQSTSRDEAIGELVQALADAGALAKKDADEVTQKVLSRERQATTGIGKGVALPHAKLKSLKKPIAAIGRSSAGIDFQALDSKPVYSVILLLSSPENPDEHLQAMETIFKHVQRDVFRKFLRQSDTQQAIVDLIEEADELG